LARSSPDKNSVERAAVGSTKENLPARYLFPVPCEFFAAIAVSPGCIAVVRAIEEKE
jgi:hypothetical protein